MDSKVQDERVRQIHDLLKNHPSIDFITVTNSVLNVASTNRTLSAEDWDVARKVYSIWHGHRL